MKCYMKNMPLRTITPGISFSCHKHLQNIRSNVTIQKRFFEVLSKIIYVTAFTCTEEYWILYKSFPIAKSASGLLITCRQRFNPRFLREVGSPVVMEMQ
jgi:hypothetical protein